MDPNRAAIAVCRIFKLQLILSLIRLEAGTPIVTRPLCGAQVNVRRTALIIPPL